MSTTPPQISDESGNHLQLGAILGQGGEGAVWDIPASPSMVAKVYHRPLTSERTDKIREMSRLPTASLSKLTAWPEKLLFRRDGPAIGLMIPKVVGGKDIHKLYSPKSRRNEFQRADWRFLLHSAANTARAFAAVHDAGHVIGDVNHGSVLVSQDSTVRLVDCDSFQIQAGGRRYLCDKGVETFTPPELQSMSLAGVVRLDNHDNFGLAVLMFQLLFLGRHPFAGRYSGKGDMPIALAIKESRFPYGSKASLMQMSRPPGTPALSTVGKSVELLFERAFAKEAASGGRPTAREWIAGIETLGKELRQCGNQQSHWFPRHLSDCPWCQMEAATGATLFPFVFQAVNVGTGVDVQSLFRRADALSIPNEGVPSYSGTPSPSQGTMAETVPVAPKTPPRPSKNGLIAVAVGLWIAILAVLPAGAFILSFVAPIALYAVLSARMTEKWNKTVAEIQAPYVALRNDFEVVMKTYRSALDRSRSDLDALENEWKQKTGMPDLTQRKAKLSQIRVQLDRLPAKRVADLDRLEKQRRTDQMSKHLERFKVINATIAGVGEGRKLTLESYGIETADDVTVSRMQNVPGFGPKLSANMMQWRRTAEMRFVFDPNRGVDPSAIAAVEHSILTERRKLETRLERDATDLIRDHGAVMNRRTALRNHVVEASKRHKQATADWNHMVSLQTSMQI